MAEISADAVKALTMTQKEFAKLLGLSQQRISQLISEGIIPRDPSTKQPMLYEGLTNYFLSKNATGDDSANFWKERSLHERAKRKMAELNLQIKEGKLYEAEVVHSELAEWLIMFRSKLNGVGHKLAPRLEGLKPAQICDIIDAEIYDILEELAENVRTGNFTDKESSDAEESAAPDG